jgi:hypothetical protein
MGNDGPDSTTATTTGSYPVVKIPAPANGGLKKLEVTLKVIFWVLPLIFAMGVWYNTAVDTTKHVQENSDKISQVSDKSEKHRSTDGHAVTKTKIDQIERDVADIKTEQRVMRTDQRRQSENLSSICQATNARCR